MKDPIFNMPGKIYEVEIKDVASTVAGVFLSVSTASFNMHITVFAELERMWNQAYNINEDFICFVETDMPASAVWENTVKTEGTDFAIDFPIFPCKKQR